MELFLQILKKNGNSSKIFKKDNFENRLYYTTYFLFCRYEKIQLQRCLHNKKVRKRIITGILVNYNLVEAKVDHGLNRRKKRKIRQSKAELKDWKISRAKDTEGWKQEEKYEQDIVS